MRGGSVAAIARRLLPEAERQARRGKPRLLALCINYLKPRNFRVFHQVAPVHHLMRDVQTAEIVGILKTLMDRTTPKPPSPPSSLN